METKPFSQLFATPRKDHCLGRLLSLTSELLKEGNRHKHIAEAALFFGKFRHNSINLEYYDRHKVLLREAGLALGKSKPTIPNGEAILSELPPVRPGYQNCTARLKVLVKQLHDEGYSRSELTDAIVEMTIHHATLSDPSFHGLFRAFTAYPDVEVRSPLPNHNGKIAMSQGAKN